MLAVLAMAFASITACKPEEPEGCSGHIDNNRDGLCDSCGDKMPATPPSGGTTENYDDKVEALNRYNITVDEGEGYTVTAPKTAIIGSDVEFSVEFSNYFDSSSAVVSANGKALSEKDGKYVIENIAADTEISVDGIVRTHYGAIKIAPLGVTVNGADRFAADGDYSFTLSLAPSATGTPLVTVNGETLTDVGGTYTVSAPRKNLVIEVTGVSAPAVAVSGEAGKGYTIEHTDTIVGGTLMFSVHIDSEHESISGITVDANGTRLTANDGVYTLENAPANVNVTVTGITKRDKITIHFENCDLPDTEAYKGTSWNETVPVRTGYTFNGWVDADGNPYVLDYKDPEVTMYATWLNADGVDYVSRVNEIISEIEKRNTEIGGNWILKLTVADNALAVEYSTLINQFTEYEKSKMTANAALEVYVAKALLISADIIGANNSNADRVVTPTYNLEAGNDDTKQNLDVTDTRKLDSGVANAHFNGINYNIQKKDADNNAILDYVYEFDKIDFSKYGKVTFWMATNYEGITLKLGDVTLFEAVKNVPENGKTSPLAHCLYRIDIQDGHVFVNGVYKCDLTEAQNTGAEAISLNVHRGTAAPYAFMDISHIYAGEKDDSLVK